MAQEFECSSTQCRSGAGKAGFHSFLCEPGFIGDFVDRTAIGVFREKE